MGNQCCAASSDDTKQIVDQNTDQTLYQEPNEHEKKQIQSKKKQQNQLKTNFYGSSGIACSRTMTTEKNSKIQFVIQDYRSIFFFYSGKIVKNDKILQKIRQESFQEDIPRKQTAIQIKSQNSISTNQIIEQEASHYLQNVFQKMQGG